MAVGFNAQADRLQSSAPPSGSGAFTAIGFAYLAADRNDYTTLVSFEGAGGVFRTLQTDADGVTLTVFDSTLGSLFSSPPVLSTGQWYAVALRYDSSRNGTLDVMPVGGSKSTYSSNNPATSLTFTKVTLGGNDGFATEFLNGRLRSWRIWDARLSDGEVDAEFLSLTAVRTSNLRSEWRLPDNSNHLTDSSGNGNTLTNPGGAGSWTTETDPSLTPTLTPTGLASTAAFGAATVVGYGADLPPTVISKGTANAATTGTVTPGYPASPAANDIIFLLAISHQPNGIGVINTPAGGWAEVAQGTYQNNSATNQGRAALFWLRAAGTESGTVSVTRTGDTGTDGVFFAQMYLVRRCATSGDPYDAVTADYGPGNATIDFGAVTVSGANRTLLAFCAQADDAPGAGTPSNYSRAVTIDTTTTGTDAQLVLDAYSNRETGTATTATNGETLGWATFHVSARPVPQSGAFTMAAAGLASTEAFGSPTVDAGAGGGLSATGLASTAAFGTPVVSHVLTATGVASGAAFGAPTVSEVVRQRGIQFNAYADGLTLASAPNNDSFSFRLWVRMDQLDNGGAQMSPFSMEDAAANQPQHTIFSLFTRLGGDAGAYEVHEDRDVGGTGGFLFTDTGHEDEWVYLCVTHSLSNNRTRLYWRGEGDALLSSDEWTGLGTYSSAMQRVLVGTCDASDQNEHFIGGIAGVAIWSGRELTAAEAQDDSEALRVLDRTSLWAEWPLQSTSDKLTDYSGNGRHLTEIDSGSGSWSLLTDGPAVALGEDALLPSGLASTVAFGSPSLGLSLSASGLASTEAFGTASIGGALSTTGIASGEAFGAPSLALGLSASGVASTEAFGAPSVALSLETSGVASAEAFGAPSLTLHLTATGLESTAAFGAPLVQEEGQETLLPSGLASTVAFGAPSLSLSLSASGLASGEAFGTAALALSLSATGIPSGTALGAPELALGLSPTGMASAEAFGSPALVLALTAEGLASGTAFGTPTVTGEGALSATGLASTVAFGSAAVSTGALTLLAHWKCDDASLGTMTDSVGGYHLTVTGSAPLVRGQVGTARRFGRSTTFPYSPSVYAIGAADSAAVAAGLSDWTVFFRFRWVGDAVPAASASVLLLGGMGHLETETENAIAYVRIAESTRAVTVIWEHAGAANVVQALPNTTVPRDGLWHSVAVIKTVSIGLATVRGYLDGVPTDTVTGLVNALGGSTARWMVGGYEATTWATTGIYVSGLPGDLDDLRFYAGAATDEEVLALASLPHQRIESLELAAHYSRAALTSPRYSDADTTSPTQSKARLT